MNDMGKYSEKRNALIKEYKAKEMKEGLTVLGVGLAILVAILLVGTLLLKNTPIAVILAIICVIFTVIYARMRTVTVKHALETKLREFENNSMY